MPKLTAAQAALELAYEQEWGRDWRAIFQQKRLAPAFREVKERAVLLAEMEREAEREELEAALRWALEEEEGYEGKMERAVRQQKRREAELRAKDEVTRMAREREARKFIELEEAAIERAVEESRVSENKRKLAEQEERLKRRVDGKKGRARNERTIGVNEDTGLYSFGPPLSAQGRGGTRAFVEDELPCPPYSPTAGSDSTIYAGCNQEALDLFPPPTWGRPAPLPTNNSPFGGTFKGDTQNSASCGRRHDLVWPDETKPTAWRNSGMHTRHWHETKTEHWGTTTRREEYHDTFQGYKEVTEATRRRL